MVKPLEIHLLGQFNLIHDGRPLTAFQADRPQTLLAYLLLHRQAPQFRRHLAFLLWPDSTESQAMGNLRNLLYTVRHALPDAESYLAVDKLTMQWRPDAPFSLDVADFEEALTAVHQTTDPAVARRRLEQAVSLYRGDLLPANYDDWLVPIRQEMAARYQAALLQLIGLLEEAGEYQTAVPHARHLFQQDPLNETGVIRLMRLYTHSGDRSGLRRLYQECVTILREELGVEPAPATQAAYEELLQLAVDVAPKPVAAPVVPLPRPLPIPATPFIGREVELYEIGQLLADPHCRLLTITGPGGMGKTRLALQTAITQQSHFPNGVAYVPLRALHSADFLAPAITSALNLTLAGSLDTAGQLLHFLTSKKMLILLDNFEHLLDGVDLVAGILAQTSGVKLLVTSRQRLDLQEEWSFALGEFTLPAAPVAEEMAANSAVTLFVQSARRAGSGFNLTTADYPAVTEICRLVSGLPLGIELAASWTRLLSCAEIAQEIERGIDFLTVSTRNIPAQHHNLRTVFDQSWELLTAAEQQLLQALTIFQGGFTRPAATNVAGATLPMLSSLIDKSLLRRVGADRYSLHELVRQYAAERLRANGQVWAEVQEKHGRFYLTRLAESETLLFSGQRGTVFEELAADIANLRDAWKWGLQQQEWPSLNRATRAYATFYELQSWNQEGLTELANMVERLRPLAKQPADPALHLFLGGILSSLGWFHFRCGQIAAARAALDEGLALIRAVTDESAGRTLQFALHQFGMVAYISGDYAAAQVALNEALTINRALADDWGLAYALAILGIVRFAQGEAAEGYSLLTESVAIWRRSGSPRLGVFSLSFFGAVAQMLGHYEEAEATLQEGLALAQAAGDRYEEATILRSLSGVSLARSDYEQAAAIVQRSLAIFTEIGDPWRITQTTILLGTIYRLQADYPGAEKAFREAYETAVAARTTPFALEALINLAELYAQTARETAAQALAGWAAAHPASNGNTRARAAKLIEQLRQSGVERTEVANSDESLETAVARILTPWTVS
jgi:predicted ATPase/DNA-binding SARP family transcriptional activator